MTFDFYGDSTGAYVLIGSSVVTIGLLVYGLKSKTWDRLALKSQINSKVKEGYVDALEVGLEGITVSDLKPIGKADFNNVLYEVTSQGQFVETNCSVRISKIRDNKIIVELINT